MKTKINFNKESRRIRLSYILNIKKIICCTLILISLEASAQTSTPKYMKPSWWFGGATAANFNFYNGSTQKLNSNLTVPRAFHNGMGVGLYLAPLIEFHRPNSRWGVMLQLGYDSRKGKFKEVVVTPCNCPMDMSTKLSYFTVEPSLRFAPFKSNFYLFGGPRLAFNLNKSFTYQQKTNPEISSQVENPAVKGDYSDINKMLISMQIGAGYDIPLSSQNRHTQFVLSPFVSFQPYFGQSPRSIETWTVTTLRVGVALKLGKGRLIPIPPVILLNPIVMFSVNSPKNIPAERRVRETFPLRNYVFFNLGSTEIPDRYILLNKDQVKDFKEDQLEVLEPKKLTGRSAREMVVYYNILNILGDRMEKNTSSTITLVGSSEKGPEDGKAMSESIKKYLVDIFGINASRINIEGRTKPKIPSEHSGGTKELDLLREGDRRVSIESTSPALLMEFQTGSDAPLKPVEILAVKEAPLDSYVSFNIDKDDFSSWSLEIKDDKEVIQNFGPYTAEKMSIPGKSILGDRPEGDYKVTLIGQMKNGETVKKDTTVHMVLWTPPINEEGMRFSVIYEFDDSKAITMYEKYLTEIVVHKIPKNGTVIIHGYTDIIGDANHNQKLSIERANDVRTIIENGLSKVGRNDVTFEVNGFGEDQSLSPFDNKLPEERFYNRTVIIDIIPHK